jgi:hypothetical protein
MPDIPAPEPEHLEAVKKTFEAGGIICTISR